MNGKCDNFNDSGYVPFASYQVLQLDYSSGVCPHGCSVSLPFDEIVLRLLCLPSPTSHEDTVRINTVDFGSYVACCFVGATIPCRIMPIWGYFVAHLSQSFVSDTDESSFSDLDRVLDELMKRCPVDTKCIFRCQRKGQTNKMWTKVCPKISKVRRPDFTGNVEYESSWETLQWDARLIWWNTGTTGWYLQVAEVCFMSDFHL